MTEIDPCIVERDVTHAIPWLKRNKGTGNWKLLVAESSNTEVRYVLENSRVGTVLMIYDVNGNGLGEAELKTYTPWVAEEGKYIGQDLGEDRGMGFLYGFR